MIEVYLGGAQEAVDSFDKAYEAKRKLGDDSAPGDDSSAPYYRHPKSPQQLSDLLAVELGVDWSAYDRAVSSK
jgi:hypothetical protein